MELYQSLYIFKRINHFYHTHHPLINIIGNYPVWSFFVLAELDNWYSHGVVVFKDN